MNKATHFSVVVRCELRGNKFVPGVCYPLRDSIRDRIEDMASKKTALLFDEEVRFITGVPYSLVDKCRRVEKLPVQPAAASSPQPTDGTPGASSSAQGFTKLKRI